MRSFYHSSARRIKSEHSGAPILQILAPELIAIDEKTLDALNIVHGILVAAQELGWLLDRELLQSMHLRRHSLGQAAFVLDGVLAESSSMYFEMCVPVEVEGWLIKLAVIELSLLSLEIAHDLCNTSWSLILDVRSPH